MLINHISAYMKQAVSFHTSMDIEIHTHSDMYGLCPPCNSKDVWDISIEYACSALTMFMPIHTHSDSLALDTALDNHNGSNTLNKLQRDWQEAERIHSY